MMKQKRVESSFKFDRHNINPVGAVVIGLLLLFAIPVLFKIIGGVLGAIFGAIGIVIGSVFGVIGIAIGAVFGMLGIVFSLFFGFMWLWLPALIIYWVVRAANGGKHKSWKHFGKRIDWGCDTNERHDAHLYEDERDSKSKRKNDNIYHV